MLVSALCSADSRPAAIVNAVIAHRSTLCCDYRIPEEYTALSRRPRSGFPARRIEWLLDGLTKDGCRVIAQPLPALPYADESDRKFLEAAHFCGSPLITGDREHHPTDALTTSVADFYERSFSGVRSLFFCRKRRKFFSVIKVLLEYTALLNVLIRLLNGARVQTEDGLDMRIPS